MKESEKWCLLLAAVLLEVLMEAVVPERASSELPLVLEWFSVKPLPREVPEDPPITSGGKGNSLFIISELFLGGCELGGEGVLTAGDFICRICFSIKTGDSLFSLNCFIRRRGFSL